MLSALLNKTFPSFQLFVIFVHPYFICHLLLPEIAVEIIKPLTDTEVTEHDIVTMTCELSKPDVKVKWLCDGQPMKSKNGLTITADGCVHTLSIKDTALTDAGKITIVAQDKSSSAHLIVKGKTFSIEEFALHLEIFLLIIMMI